MRQLTLHTKWTTPQQQKQNRKNIIKCSICVSANNVMYTQHARAHHHTLLLFGWHTLYAKSFSCRRCGRSMCVNLSLFACGVRSEQRHRIKKQRNRRQTNGPSTRTFTRSTNSSQCIEYTRRHKVIIPQQM